jgi:tRNA-dihydrouridine synthase
MAPFQGITTSVFRKVYTDYFTGIDKLFTPFFTNIHSKTIKSPKNNELKSIKENNIRVVPQILSNNADEILRFAKYVYTLGFNEINWNLGCPFPRVANKKRGSGLLPFTKDIDSILNKIMPDLPVNISIKARLGYNNYEDIINLIPVFNNYRIVELAVHTRIGKQLYTGDTILKNFDKILEKSNIPIGYNGDIFTFSDFKRITQMYSDISFIMLGRGLLVDPFLPEIIKNNGYLEFTNKKKIIEKFVTNLYVEYRKKHNNRLTTLNVLKEYWWYLSHSFENPHKVFKTLKKVKTFDEYEEAVKKIFDAFSWVGQESNLFRQQRISK